MKIIAESEQSIYCDITAPCFLLLSENEINFIRKSKTMVYFRKGENLTKQGTFASFILFIVDGIVKQYIEGDLNKNYNLRLYKTGEFIGLSAIYNENRFNYSSVAITDTHAFLIEKEAMLNILENNALFASKIMKAYCSQNNFLFNALRNVIYKQMNGKIADALLYLDKETYNSSSVFPYLSRKDLAEFAGTSVESAVKTLKNFEKENIIKLEEKNIVLLDKEKLEEISKRG
ncbi:MAG: Crp/Fnr family transcriptional regulator [Bacteroidetes bacterium]|nr:Crp/Fnr family transcriptional regulator [Bacteroidota bacterium]